MVVFGQLNVAQLEPTANQRCKEANEWIYPRCYVNSRFGFSLLYPESWEIEELSFRDTPIILLSDTSLLTMAVLPSNGNIYGEVDVGVIRPKKQVVGDILIGKYPAEYEEYTFRDGSVRMIIRLQETPLNWQQDNRIDIATGPENVETKLGQIRRILKNIEFLK